MEDLENKLKKSYGRWEYVYKYGASDPSWEDGTNLNLVRNHIIYYKKQMEEKELSEYPEIYYKELPPEVELSYMARADEIRRAAQRSLERYKADKNYQYILENRKFYSKRTRDRLCIDNVVNYVKGLEVAIKKNRLVYMRRHENGDTYLHSFAECVKRMQDTSQEEVQLSFL